MSEQQTNLVNKFNLAINTLVEHIVEHYGDISARAAQCIVSNIIRFSPNEPISFFLLNIYSNDDYRHNILIQNDDFFINNQMDDLTQGDSNKMAKLFEFKELWKVCDDNTKLFIKKTMLVLVKICQKYISTL